jgi:hypothetical protein
MGIDEMPRQFTDNKGQKWNISITIWKTRFVRDRLPLDLFNRSDWAELMDSLGSRFAYIWWLVQDQAKELGVSDVQFEERLYGEGILFDASMEFMAELADFFRRVGNPQKFVEMTDAARTALERDRKLEMDPKKMADFRDLLETIVGEPSTAGDKSPD